MSENLPVIFRDQNRSRFIRKYDEGRLVGFYNLRSSRGKKLFEAHSKENDLSSELPEISALPFEKTYRRVASTSTCFYHDLMGGKAVEVSQKGVRVIASSGINFLHPETMSALPIPDIERGDVSLLRRYLNINDEQFLLVVAYLVFCLVGKGAYPVLLIHGTHGSAKTSLLKILKAIIDPNPVSLNSVPRSTREAAIVAQDQYLVTFDNVSRLSQEMSDFLCRLSTGGSYQTRKLFTDSETQTFIYHRPCILNGLVNFVSKADLRSRVMSIKTNPGVEKRIPEGTLWDDFNNDLPRILGGLYKLSSESLRVQTESNYFADERLADFCILSRSVFQVLVGSKYQGSIDQYFQYVFNKYVNNSMDILLEDPVYLTLMKLTQKGKWKGYSQDLIKEVDEYCSKFKISKAKIPSTPSSMGRHISMMEELLKNSPLTFKEFRNRGKIFSRKVKPVMEEESS